MKTSGNSICDDDGRDCYSPYHNSNRCPICKREDDIAMLRESFRREYEAIDDAEYSNAQDKIDALGLLEEKYQDLGVDISKIIDEGMSYLDF